MDNNFFNMTKEKFDRINVLKKEFDSFSDYPGENTKTIIERYRHLVRSTSKTGITKRPEEWIEKIVSALPQEE